VLPCIASVPSRTTLLSFALSLSLIHTHIHTHKRALCLSIYLRLNDIAYRHKPRCWPKETQTTSNLHYDPGLQVDIWKIQSKWNFRINSIPITL
jgi:hypothetical protein